MIKNTESDEGEKEMGLGGELGCLETLSTVPSSDAKRRKKEYVTLGKVSQNFRYYGLEVTAKKGDKTVFVVQSFNGEDCIGPPGYNKWVSILFQCLHDLTEGNLGCYIDDIALSEITAPLTDLHASNSTIIYSTSVLSLRFNMEKPTEQDIAKITKVYFDVKAVPNLVYSTKAITKRTGYDISLWKRCFRASGNKNSKPVSKLTLRDLDALIKIYAFTWTLLKSCHQFIDQFCDAAIEYNAVPLLQDMLRVADRQNQMGIGGELVMGILIFILRHAPERTDFVEKVFFGLIGWDGDLRDVKNLLACGNILVENRTRILIKRLCCYRLQAWPFPRNAKLYLRLYNLLSRERIIDWYDPFIWRDANVGWLPDSRFK